ncbi:hypothetical protein ACFV84_04425 [Kitasatospora sp. NPDC059811]|uniref:hypothetical protein n=1 Tax=unclassified Kitasatospora TaxID=2633591 RepID=UPI00365DE52A
MPSTREYAARKGGFYHAYYVLAGAMPVLVNNCDLAEMADDHRSKANSDLGVKAGKNIAVARVRSMGRMIS